MCTTIDRLYFDIWEQIFQYFNAHELLFSFPNITQAIDEVLTLSKSRFLFRGLVVDVFVRMLPEKLRLNQLSSLELHQSSSLDIIEECTALRSLKLVGDSEWIILILGKILRSHIEIEQLVVTTPSVGSLDKIFTSIALISSLNRLEIYANELEERVEMSRLKVNQTNIRRFTLHTCPSMSWNDVPFMLPALTNVHSLDISLSQQDTIGIDFTFPNLRYVRLLLHESSFESISKILLTIPYLKKLQLDGLVDDEEFVFSPKWISLFNTCFYLNVVIVRLSFQGNRYIFRQETIQTALHQINLNLKCIDDDSDFFETENDQHRWWILSGMIIKHSTSLEKHCATFQ